MFGRAGFAAAQVVQIARVAGVSIGTAYNYVEDKDPLLLLVAEHAFGDLAGDRAFPVATPDRALLIASLEATLAERVRVSALGRALAPTVPARDRAAEVG